MSAELSFFSFSFLSFLSLSSSFSLESKCSLQMCRSCCTFRTFPEPWGGRAAGRDQRTEGSGPAPPSASLSPTHPRRRRCPPGCWRSCGKVRTPPPAPPGWPRSPLLSLRGSAGGQNPAAEACSSWGRLALPSLTQVVQAQAQRQPPGVGVLQFRLRFLHDGLEDGRGDVPVAGAHGYHPAGQGGHASHLEKERRRCCALREGTEYPRSLQKFRILET